MSDEMKLLTALCEALGFEIKLKVERIKGTQEKAWPEHYCFGEKPFPDWQGYEFIGDGKYVEVKCEATYELVKKKINPTP